MAHPGAARMAPVLLGVKLKAGPVVAKD